MKRQIFSIALLIALTAPVIGTYCWLQYQKVVVKREVKWRLIEGMDKEDLVLLRFSKDQTQNRLGWKHPGEFQYNGEMYDVVERLETVDSVFYWCWWDRHETRLNGQIAELASRAMQQDNQVRKNHDRLFNFYKSLYFGKYGVDMCPFFEKDIKNNNEWDDRYDPVSCPPPTPPPELS